MNSRHENRYRFPSRLLAVLAVTLAAVGGVLSCGPTASAVAPRTVSMTQTASTVLSGATGCGGMVVDSVRQRAYILSYPASTLEVFDVSGASPVHLASIGPIVGARQVAVSARTNEVVVAGGTSSGVLSVIDTDPSSPTNNRVVASIPTDGSMGASYVDVSPDGIAFVGHSFVNALAVVDLKTRGVKTMTTPNGLSDVEVDQQTGVAYLANFYDQSISAVRSDGTISTTSIAPDTPRAIAAARGLVMVAVEAPDRHNFVESFDSQTWTHVASSPDVGSTTQNLEVDPDLRLLYIAAFTKSDPAVRALRLGTLEPQFASPAVSSDTRIAVDRRTHRVFVSQALATVTTNTIDVAPQRGVARIGGADRFEVSADVSADSSAPGVPVAYLASGLVFPDALSGSAAAGAVGGPVLLTGRDSVPPEILRELIRLQPQRIVVLGGPASISETVIDTVSAVASTTRIAGADRFEVSAAVSSATFAPGPAVAYVASGLVFADALSGSAAAGREGAPVLLTLKDALPESIGAELRRLHPAAIVVLGGVNSVSEAVVGALGSIAPTTRIAGADRFDVSAAVSAATFGDGARTVYVASGGVFPDALSGSAAAVENRAPVLLTTRDAVPSAVLSEIDRLKPTRIVLLGGPNSVSDAVNAILASHLGP
ncbi:cell wall-binding repeat-containing protein [Herbiconiux sp. YIM B11900]|uniref:cell wall-binding repeat-containing protein n=1 Tax=Herbiconiux sp. YIM B11900 TaxID=3404131 RepID=UPI003F844D43